jgi:hypothetical protein
MIPSLVGHEKCDLGLLMVHRLIIGIERRRSVVLIQADVSPAIRLQLVLKDGGHLRLSTARAIVAEPVRKGIAARHLEVPWPGNSDRESPAIQTQL